MFDFIRRRFGRRRQPPPCADVRLLDLERQAQLLRLDLEEREQLIAALRSDLEKLRRTELARLEEARIAAIERVLTEAATPAAQLTMQGHLLEADGKPVHARDILTVARRLVRLLENEGLVLEGRIGERVSFDPDRHALLANDDAAPGHSVLVRFPSVSYRGKILRKAGVDKTGE